MSRSPVPLSLQWSLNETADGFYKISKEIVRAASTDNIQSNVLDSIDKFGATLAICPETEYHVQQQLRRAQGSRALNFLKSRIGFVSGDCSDALSQSTGGVRFLCLAATLATCQSFEAAKATREMMRTSSRSDQIVPTIAHLKDIHEAIGYKMHRVDFADQVIRWQERVTGLAIQEYRQMSGETQDQSATPAAAQGRPHFYFRDNATRYFQDDFHPLPEVIAALVDAFRQTHRLGEGSFVRITTSNGSAWLIAFCEWCIGVPPKVVDMKSGRLIQDDPDAKSGVLIQLNVGDTKIEIATHIEAPTRLWEIGQPSGEVSWEWSGMVSLTRYSRKFIQECELDTEHGSRALIQVLPFSTVAVISRIPFLRDHITNSQKGSSTTLSISDTNLRYFSKRVAATIKEYLDGAEDQDTYRLRELQEGQQISDLYNMKFYIENTLRKQCMCASCSDDASSHTYCLIHELEYHVSFITAQILALSFFELIEPVKLFFSASRLPQSVPQWSSLIAKSIAILFPNSKVGTKFPRLNALWKATDRIQDPVTLFDLFDLGLYLIGHQPASKNNWIASAGQGQVVFAHFFNSCQIEPRSIALIDGGPGVILHKQEKFTRVAGGFEGIPAQRGIEVSQRPQVDQIRNLLEPQDLKLDWEVTARPDHLSLKCSTPYRQLGRNPAHALAIALECRFATSCPHDPLAPLESPDDQAYYDTHTTFMGNAENRGRVAVIAVHGNDSMRFLVLASSTFARGVIRLNACLKCCLEICRAEGLRYIVC